MSDSPHPNADPSPEQEPTHQYTPDPAPNHHCGCGHDHDHNHYQSDQPVLTGKFIPAGEVEWTRQFLLFLEMVVLLLWAVLMVWFYASGRINTYLIGEGTFRIQVLVGGLVLAVMGFFNWQMRAVPETCGHDHGEEADCGGGPHHPHPEQIHHHHTHHADGGHSPSETAPAPHTHEGTPAGRGMALAILALSVTAAASFTPDDFSDGYKRNMLTAYASRPAGNNVFRPEHRLTPEGSAAAAGGVTLAMLEKYQPRNKAGNFELDVMQLYYSGSDPEYAKVMQGQSVETVGQLVKDTVNPSPGRWRVFVLQMTCCAADARPYSLPVEFIGTAPSLQEMGWYRLTGKLEYKEEKGVTIAVLKTTASEPTLRPKEQRRLF